MPEAKYLSSGEVGKIINLGPFHIKSSYRDNPTPEKKFL